MGKCRSYEDYRNCPAKMEIMHLFRITSTDLNLLWVIDAVLAAGLPYRWTTIVSGEHSKLYRSPDNVISAVHPAVAFYSKLVTALRYASSAFNSLSREYFYTQEPPQPIIDILQMTYFLEIPFFRIDGGHCCSEIWVAMIAVCSPLSEFYVLDSCGRFINKITGEVLNSNPDYDIFYDLAHSGIEQVGNEIVPEFVNCAGYRLEEREILVYSFDSLSARIVEPNLVYKVQYVKIPYFELQWDMHENILEGVRKASAPLFKCFSFTKPKDQKIGESLCVRDNTVKTRESEVAVHISQHLGLPLENSSAHNTENALVRDSNVFDIQEKGSKHCKLALEVPLGAPPATIIFHAVCRLTDRECREYLHNCEHQIIPWKGTVSERVLSRLFSSLPNRVLLHLRLEFHCVTGAFEQACKCSDLEAVGADFAFKNALHCDQGILPAIPNLPQCFAAIFIENEAVSLTELLENMRNDISMAEMCIGSNVQFEGLPFVITEMDSLSKEWYRQSLRRICRSRAILETALVENGHRAIVCQTPEFDMTDIDECRVKISTAIASAGELYEELCRIGYDLRFEERWDENEQSQSLQGSISSFGDVE